MTDELPVAKDNAELIQRGLKLLEDAVAHFMDLDDEHAKALTSATLGVLNLGIMLFNIYNKDE